MPCQPRRAPTPSAAADGTATIKLNQQYDKTPTAKEATDSPTPTMMTDTHALTLAHFRFSNGLALLLLLSVSVSVARINFALFDTYCSSNRETRAGELLFSEFYHVHPVVNFAGDEMHSRRIIEILIPKVSIIAQIHATASKKRRDMKMAGRKVL